MSASETSFAEGYRQPPEHAPTTGKNLDVFEKPPLPQQNDPLK